MSTLKCSRAQNFSHFFFHIFGYIVTFHLLTFFLDNNNSDGKASLKRQKSPEITADTQGMSKFY